MTIKSALYEACESHINSKLKTVQDTIFNIQEALLSESKSSAGDKHETGRAMLQLEREKAGRQLAEIQKTKEALAKLDINNTSEIVCLGSVVYTSKANYYLAISAGEIKIGNNIFYAISPRTPIGELLMSKTVGDELCFRSQSFKIEKIL